MGQFTFPKDPTGGTLTQRVEEVRALVQEPKSPLDFLRNFVVEFNKTYRDKLLLQASLDTFKAIGEDGKVELYATVYVMALYNRRTTRTIEMHLPKGDEFPVKLGVYTPDGIQWRFDSINQDLIEPKLFQLLQDDEVKAALTKITERK